LEFADDQGITGSLRLAMGESVAAFHARVVVPDIGVIDVRDDDVAPPKRHDLLVVRCEGLWAELLCETPDEHCSDRGERIAVGFDLEWETPDRVVGEVLVGRARYELTARGTFAVTP
jgi:hypothetical protein